MPDYAEYNEAIANLEATNFEVDYIITHAAPEDTMCMFHPRHEKKYPLNNFLEWVRKNTKYKHWYFGHLPVDEDLWRNQTALWFDVRNIEISESVDN